MNTKLSIIVPTHNSEKFIRECVESIMHQTYENLEIICVDSSKDSTVSILWELAAVDTRIQIIQDANGSYGHKINVGIQQATGEYIGIVESDDVIVSNIYADMLEKLGSHKVDFIKSNALHFGTINGRRVYCPEKKAFLEGYYNKVVDLENHRDIALFGRPTIWTALYRRDFLLENQLWLNETPGASYQDTSFVILVGLMAKNAIFDNNAYYCYRRDNENSSVLSKEKVDCVRQEFEYIVSYLRKNHLYTDEVAKLLRRRKLVTYNWNCMRLSDALAEVFIESISHEMKEYTESEVAGYTEYEKQIYGLLVKERILQEHRAGVRDAEEQAKKLLDAFHKDEQFVLVGAGKIGQRILELQKYLDKKFIVSVADNGANVVGTEVRHYSVIKVEDAVQQFPGHHYIIANKNHAEEIEWQLLSLDVLPEKIMKVKALPSEENLLLQCIEYYK